MIGLPIEWIAALIIVLVVALAVFTLYMVIERHRENKRTLLAATYLNNNRIGWYDYLRTDGVPEDHLIPRNDAEVKAVEELFRMLVHNVKEDGMEERISGFANRWMSGFYRKKLNGRNWGERMNALYRIYDFGIDSLTVDCRDMAKKSISEEEFFLLLLIDMKFYPETFVRDNLLELCALSANDAKELLFRMQEATFEETVCHFDELELTIQYALVDVIGMKLDATYVPFLETQFNTKDSELRIRVLRAYNSLGIVPVVTVYEAAVESDVWQERHQAAKMLKWLPQQSAVRYAAHFEKDDMFLVREEAKLFSTASSIEDQVSPLVAAAAEDEGWLLDTQSPDGKGGDQI
ncbi:HEAT repeat domain-containing protein [Sporosarcina obsidiansis]|uniref:HEAT repeat domain-containing protein n=1 Tax=Sporosarcina obsidiansis TaxID=2660748 RepID=UPI00129BDEA5|nr:hypothetical protein [Sporosarcina obsidiansis]